MLNMASRVHVKVRKRQVEHRRMSRKLRSRARSSRERRSAHHPPDQGGGDEVARTGCEASLTGFICNVVRRRDEVTHRGVGTATVPTGGTERRDGSRPDGSYQSGGTAIGSRRPYRSVGTAIRPDGSYRSVGPQEGPTGSRSKKCGAALRSSVKRAQKQKTVLQHTRFALRLEKSIFRQIR